MFTECPDYSRELRVGGGFTRPLDCQKLPVITKVSTLSPSPALKALTSVTWLIKCCLSGTSVYMIRGHWESVCVCGRKVRLKPLKSTGAILAASSDHCRKPSSSSEARFDCSFVTFAAFTLRRFSTYWLVGCYLFLDQKCVLEPMQGLVLNWKNIS